MAFEARRDALHLADELAHAARLAGDLERQRVGDAAEALLERGCEGSEIASLYTLTRYLGGGIGGHLIRFGVERAAAAGRRFVFACTTSERVVAFFEANGFREVGADEVPAEKWQGYPPDRRERLRCLRREIV